MWVTATTMCAWNNFYPIGCCFSFPSPSNMRREGNSPYFDNKLGMMFPMLRSDVKCTTIISNSWPMNCERKEVMNWSLERLILVLRMDSHDLRDLVVHFGTRMFFSISVWITILVSRWQDRSLWLQLDFLMNIFGIDVLRNQCRFSFIFKARF